MIRTEVKKIDDMFSELCALANKETWLLNRDRLLRLPHTLFKVWYSGYRNVANEAIQYNGNKYFSIKACNPSQSLIVPSETAAIEFYRLIKDADDREWQAGEWVLNGFRRYDDGVLYEVQNVALPDIFLNQNRPSLTPTNWKIVN
jgi:hypothetical protein